MRTIVQMAFCFLVMIVFTTMLRDMKLLHETECSQITGGSWTDCTRISGTPVQDWCGRCEEDGTVSRKCSISGNSKACKKHCTDCPPPLCASCRTDCVSCRTFPILCDGERRQYSNTTCAGAIYTVLGPCQIPIDDAEEGSCLYGPDQDCGQDCCPAA